MSDIDLLSSLNESQRRAVTHDGGPLMVLAGPGTGKTRVIIHRIAWAIRERGVEPERVLALTFTKKAAEELRTRLSDLIGPAVAARVNVHTFNGYGWRALQRFADVLDLPPSLTLIDPVQSGRLVREVVLDLGLFPWARGAGLESIAVELGRAFEHLANIGKSCEDCTKFAAELGKREPDPSEMDEAKIRAERERFLHEARAYQEYCTRRWARGLLTYNDQLILPMRLLRKHAGPASILRSEASCVVVDEFQDCNPAQVEFLKLLLGRQRDRDVCVVGDDDQGIYAFRGADDRAFQRFKDFWRDAEDVQLVENYRSGEEIIGVANAVIGAAVRRFRPEKRVERAAASKAGSARVECIGLATENACAGTVAEMILADRAGVSPPRGWDSYAVLCRSNGEVDRVADALGIAGVPYERETNRSVLDDEGVSDVLAWCRWLTNPDSAPDARRVLIRPPACVPVERAVALEQAWRGERSRLEHGLDGGGTSTYAAYLSAHREDEGVDRAVKRYEQLRAALVGLRGEAALQRVITELDVAHAELLPGRERARRVTALIALLDLAREKQPLLEPPGDLGALMSYIEALRGLGKLSSQMGLGDVDEDSTESQSEGPRVRVLTAHKAKGLEFDTVFIPRIGVKTGCFGAVGEDNRWKPPAGLFDAETPEEATRRGHDEERRVFYVACTRAMRRLVLLAKWNKALSKGEAAHFFEEIARHERTPPLPVTVTPPCQEVGIGVGGPTDTDDAESGLEPAERLAARLKSRARQEAASALERADRPDVDEDGAARAGMEIAKAAGRLAALASAQATGVVPAWHDPAHPDVAALAARVKGERGGRAGTSLFSPLKPPLALSYSTINKYQYCPACYYIQYRMGLRDAPGDEVTLGTFLHTALETHFKAVQQAESEGLTPPGMEELRRTARRLYAQALGRHGQADKGLLSQLDAQLEQAFSRSSGGNILLIEERIRFPFSWKGVEHTLEAKIDRVDQAKDKRLHVVDYKTGGNSEKYKKPVPRDLQMNIYLMALRHHFGPDIDGHCEYWVLSTPERGKTIAFADLDPVKVAQDIGKVIDGMLAGEFPRGKKCKGDCALLGD